MKEEDIRIEDGEEQDNTASDTRSEAGTEGEEPRQDGSEAAPESEQDPLDIALKKIEELTTKYKYLAAEFDNYRKRTLKERAELILNGGMSTVKALLPVVDDMERALKNGEKTDDAQVLREGMELIYNKTMKTLEGMGVKKMEAEGTDFDTDLHEAVAMVPGMGDENKGKVIGCTETGYTMNDKVIRHAKVAVGQ